SGRLMLRMMYSVSLLLWRGLPGSQAWRDAPPAHSALRQPPPPDSVRSLTSRQMEQRQHCLAKLELVQAKQAVRLAIPARSAALSPERTAAHREQISLAKSRTPLPQSRQ